MEDIDNEAFGIKEEDKCESKEKIQELKNNLFGINKEPESCYLIKDEKININDNI